MIKIPYAFFAIGFSFLASNALATPDLIVSSIRYKPENARIGDPVRIHINVTNAGDTDTPIGSMTGIGVYIDGKSFAPAGGRVVIKAGESREFPLQKKYKDGTDALWNLTEEAHQILAVVDDVNRIKESSESNNKLSVMLSAPKPDYVISRIELSPADPTPGEKVSVGLVVKNIGKGIGPRDAIKGSAIYLNGNVFLSAATISDILPGEEATIMGTYSFSGGELTWMASEGTHQIFASIDDINRINEEDESNNGSTLTFNVEKNSSRLDMSRIDEKDEICSPISLDYRAPNPSKKKVYAHYMMPIRMSMDNRIVTQDYWTKNYMNPFGENSKFLASGGYARSRPLYVSPSAQKEFLSLNYQREVRLAIANGIDGFMLDILTPSPSGLQSFLDAVLKVNQELGTDFSILPILDGLKVEDMPAIVEMVRIHPSAARLGEDEDSRLLVSAYLPHRAKYTFDWWKTFLSEVSAKDGRDVAFIPIFPSYGGHADSYTKVAGDWDQISYAISIWAGAAPGNSKTALAATPQLHKKGLKYMATVRPQDYRTRYRSGSSIFCEAENSATLRTGWKAAIDADADFVQLVTWNDYSENSQVAPSFGTQYGYYYLNSYFASQYKNNSAPAIKQDTVFLFHRNQLSQYRGSSPLETIPTKLSESSYKNSAGKASAKDEVEAVVFISEESFTRNKKMQLVLTMGFEQKTFDIQAPGISVFNFPLRLGKVSAKLIDANGEATVALESPFAVSADALFTNMMYHSAIATPTGNERACGFYK